MGVLALKAAANNAVLCCGVVGGQVVSDRVVYSGVYECEIVCKWGASVYTFLAASDVCGTLRMVRCIASLSDPTRIALSCHISQRF